MRKLMSKKGFTLVELMIVIVIMGILVAVAIPVYGAVTKNAEKKTCISNMRDIKSTAATYQMQGGTNGNPIKFAAKSDISTDVNFKKMFEGGNLPKCPTGSDYTVEAEDTSDGCKITVTCAANTADTNLGHVLPTA